jgi:desulfoferrodoxin (superoxide reductase-like protein)
MIKTIVFTKPKVVVYAKLEGKGKIIALAYCNLHSIWKKQKKKFNF